MSSFSWFEFWIFVLFSLPVTTGQSQLISSPQPITVQVGDDVTLPCRLDPPISASSRAIEWTKPGLDPEYIHVHQDGRLVYQSQNPLFSYRTALFVDQLINGNVSLKLYRVKTSDAGRYRCFVPSLWKEAFIHLSVGEKGDDKDSFMSRSNSAPLISITVVLVILVIVAVVLVVWIWRKYKTEEMMHHEAKERELLMMESKKNEEGRKEKPKEEELRDVTQVIETLRGQKEDLEKLKEQLTFQAQGSEKLLEETEQKMKTVEKEITEKGGDKTANRAQGYTKLREILQEVNWSWEEKRRDHQQLMLITEKLLKKTIDDANRLTERKSRAEIHGAN